MGLPILSALTADGGTSLTDDLRPYQLRGVQFLLERSSALLADEMGLGKTVQVAAALDLLLQKPDMIERSS